jgi:hypothetical protein
MEIIINGIRAELGDSEPAITKKSIDVNSPTARFIDFTNKFQLPDTEINRKIFESPQGIGSNNRSFDKLYDVTISDVFQIFKGKGFLDAANNKRFSFQVVDASKELFKGLESKLNSLSWEDCDTILTEAGINALDTVNPVNCWIWGQACYHESAIQINTDQTTGDARCKYSRPSFYVNALLKRAIEVQGYGFSFPSPDLAFSACHKDFFFTSYQKTLNGVYSAGSLTGLNTNDFAHVDLTVVSGSINIGSKVTVFRLRGAVAVSGTVEIVIRATDNVDPTKVSDSKLIINASTTYVDFTTSEFTSDNGNTVTITITGASGITFTDTLLYTTLSDKSGDLSTNPYLGYKIKAYDNLPEMSYLDLFKLYCTTFNKYHSINNLDKSFSFESFSQLSKMNSVDWSDKFVIDSETIAADFPGLCRVNYLRYENDLTVNPDLGQDYFVTDNESLADKGDYLVLKFGASNEVVINSNDIAHVKVYNDITRIPDQEINIRLFVVSGSKLQFTPLNWQNLKAYYANFFLSLYRIRAITAEFDLKKLDVLSWTPAKLAYIDYFKSTFIVLEISNFIPGRFTKVKLLNYGR